MGGDAMRVLMLCLLVAGCSVAEAEFVTAPDADFSFTLGAMEPEPLPLCPYSMNSITLTWQEHEGIEAGELSLPCLPVPLFDGTTFWPEPSCSCKRPDIETICIYVNGLRYSGWPDGACPEVTP